MILNNIMISLDDLTHYTWYLPESHIVQVTKVIGKYCYTIQYYPAFPVHWHYVSWLHCWCCYRCHHQVIPVT